MKKFLRKNGKEYNNSITESTLSRQESINPNNLDLIIYKGPKDTCNEFPSGKLGNMAGGFPFTILDEKWYSTEHLYLCGEWSQNDSKSIEVQEYIRKMRSGVYAKRCSKTKYKGFIRPDFQEFRHQWMLWCVWQKCILNPDFAKLLKSIPKNKVIVEVVPNDPIWAAYPDEEGILRGANGMGKILTICRRCLIHGMLPDIDLDLLNSKDIYILGHKIDFKQIPIKPQKNINISMKLYSRSIFHITPDMTMRQSMKGSSLYSNNAEIHETLKKPARKVCFDDYRDTYDQKLLNEYLSNPCGIDIEFMRSQLYGYTFTKEYAEGNISDDFDLNTYPTRILTIAAIASSGDGKTPETAFCVIDVHQEYQILDILGLRVKRQSLVGLGIDCLELYDNEFDLERIYFDVSRRMQVDIFGPIKYVK